MNRKILLTYLKENFNDIFAYNEFNGNILILNDYKLNDNLILKKGNLTDNSINTLWGYFSESDIGNFNEQEISNAIKYVASSQSFNPIKKMLDLSLEQSEQLDPFLIVTKYINIEDNKYNRLVLDLFFRGAISRILTPGIQFDYCLDLVGKQGTGKTSFLRNIFNGYSGNISNFTAKDEVLKMLDYWCVVDDELVASNGTKFEEIKRAITETNIVVRLPYDKRPVKFPVNHVFARTTNDFSHLKDATGDRRFLPLEVLERDFNQPIQIDENDFYNIWGNYYRSYLQNKNLFYEENSKEAQLINKERERFKLKDEVIEQLEWYLNQPIPTTFYSKMTKEDRIKYYKDLLEGKKLKEKFTKSRIKRNKIAINCMIEELSILIQNKKNINAKIRMYMDNLNGWEKKSSIAFGKFNTSGWKKIR